MTAIASLRCMCSEYGIPPRHAPCRRFFSNGTEHFGKWCRECGAWFSMKRADVAESTEIDDFDADRRADFLAEVISARSEAAEESTAAWRRWYESVYLWSSHWRSFRGQVLERRPQCEGCGVSRAMEVHHKTYARLGAELLSDVLSLCSGCHRRIHRHNTAMCPCNDCVDSRGGSRIPSSFSEEGVA